MAFFVKSMKQSGVMSDVDGHYEWPSCQTSSSPLLEEKWVKRSEHVGTVIFNWCCYSTPNASWIFAQKTYLLKGSTCFDHLKKKSTYMKQRFSSVHASLHSNFQPEKRKLFWTSWMPWEKSRKWTKRFCIPAGFGKSCGAVWNFYFKSWKQQLQRWLKAKRGKLF